MMICKIARNEGIISVFLLIFIIGSDCSFLSSGSQSIQELCSSNRYIYSVRPEQQQQLRLTYNTSTGDINKWYQKSKRKCRKEFKTNDGASHFVVIISNMSIPSCSEKCHCNYFEIAEPGFSEKFCGNHKEEIYFESKSDYLSIDFHHGLSMLFEVTLIFTVERNTYIIPGSPKEAPHYSGHFIETPYFPNTYQSDYTSEYFFHTDAQDGRVMLVFLDFQIAPASFIEIGGHNGTLRERFNGEVFRPPVFVSQSNELNLKFEANKQPGRSGFRAVCYFLKQSDVKSVKPSTDCGGLKFDYGGAIILENSENKLYDCLWRIGSPIFPQDKPYFLTVSNISLINIGPKASLEFRDGLYSNAKVVSSIECTNSNCSAVPSEITVSSQSGLYVRFIGLLNHSSFLGMIYSTYHNGNCSHAQSNCQGKCLFPALVCDGLKHCPDGSDEQECTKPTVIEATHPTVEKKKSTSPRQSAAAFHVVFALGICGLFVVSIVVAIIIFRGVKPAPSVEHPEQLEIVSDMSGLLSRVSPVPSTLDHLPPSYDDFIQATDRYPPLLYTRAVKRHSEPYTAHCNILHTTSFCEKADSRSVHSAIDLSSHRVSVETMFANDPIVLTEPSCSYERRNADWLLGKPGLKCAKSGLKRGWSSDSKLDELNTSDCHLHLSITHCVHRQSCRLYSRKQYYSLPINFKINNCKSNDIDIIFPNNAGPKIDFSKNRHLSLCSTSSMCSPKVLTIKTRCQSDPCQFSVHYSLHH